MGKSLIPFEDSVSLSANTSHDQVEGENWKHWIVYTFLAFCFTPQAMSEKSQSQKGKRLLFHSYEVLRGVKSIGTEIKMVGQGLREGEIEVVF